MKYNPLISCIPTIILFVSCSIDLDPEEPCREDVPFHFRIDGGYCRHFAGGPGPPLGACDASPGVIRDSTTIGIDGCVSGGTFRIIFGGQDFCAASPTDIQIDSIMVGIDSKHFSEILTDTVIAVSCTTSTNSVGRVSTIFTVEYELTVRDFETGEIVRMTEGVANIPYY